MYLQLYDEFEFDTLMYSKKHSDIEPLNYWPTITLYKINVFESLS